MTPLEIVVEALSMPHNAAFKYEVRPELQRRILEFSKEEWKEMSDCWGKQNLNWVLNLCQVLSPAKHGRVATDLLLEIVNSAPNAYLIPCSERLIAQQALTAQESQHLISLFAALPIDPKAKNQTAFRSHLVSLLEAGQTSPPISEASEYSIHQKDALEISEKAACYECLTVFSPSEISEFTDGGKTALCPYCGIDAVLPSNAGFPFSQAGLEALNEYWFG